jgi:2-iminobutanoate/2-iminopropanoate deaminase
LKRETLNPPTLPPPTGASDGTPFYSWTAKKGNMLFLAGMSPYTLDKQLAGDGLQEQTRQCFRNMETALGAAGASLDDVCSVTIYTRSGDLQADVYPEINPVCHEFFPTDPPARACMGGIELPRHQELVMVSAVAVLG